jgi:hypothetical protein
MKISSAAKGKILRGGGGALCLVIARPVLLAGILLGSRTPWRSSCMDCLVARPDDPSRDWLAVINRGNHRRGLFAGKSAAGSFQACWFEAAGRFGWRRVCKWENRRA